MIKATISNETKRTAFAKANAKRIARSKCSLKPTLRGVVLNNYKLIASGKCTLQKINTLDNVIQFAKQQQKEVA
jgi:hypothetical protein